MGNGAGQPGAYNSYAGTPRNDFKYAPPYGIGAPGAVVQQGGGGSPVMDPFFRNVQDASRSMWRRTPAAQYPDGYLDTSIVSRQNDRLLDAVRNRLNDRSYTRGVHKGERIDQADYKWPVEFNPMSGIRAEAQGMRQAPVYADVPSGAEMRDGMMPASGAINPSTLSPTILDNMRRLLPMTRW